MPWVASLLLGACGDDANRAKAVATPPTASAATATAEQPGRVVAELPATTERADAFSGGLARFASTVDGKTRFGYVDRTGRVVVEPLYEIATHFRDGTASVSTDFKAKGYALIDTSGKPITEEKYRLPLEFSEGLAIATLGHQGTGRPVSRKGVIDKAGKEIFPFQEGTIWPYSDGKALASYRKNGRQFFGYIDREGKEVLPIKYAQAAKFSEGLAAVKASDAKTGGWGFIDHDGKLVIAPKFDDVYWQFAQGRAAVKAKEDGVEGVGLIDRSGTRVGPLFKAIFIAEKSDGLFALAFMDARPGPGLRMALIDDHGATIGGPFDAIGSFGDGLAPYRIVENGQPRWGYIDAKGKVVVPAKFDQAARCAEGLCAVKVGAGEDGKWGFADLQGSVRIQPQFKQSVKAKGPNGEDTTMDVPPLFNDGVATVRRASDGKWVVIARR